MQYVTLLFLIFQPFGNNIITASNRLNENILSLWDIDNCNTPIYNFSGNNDSIVTFCWRSQNNYDYQLVSWGKVQTCKLYLY